MIGDIRPEATQIESLIARGLAIDSRDPAYVAELNEYGIRCVIGRGGMGVVLKAFKRRFDRTIAIKVLRPDLDDDAIERFTREAKVQRRSNRQTSSPFMPSAGIAIGDLSDTSCSFVFVHVPCTAFDCGGSIAKRGVRIRGS